MPYKLFVNTVNIVCTAYISYTHSGIYADLYCYIAKALGFMVLYAVSAGDMNGIITLKLL